VLLSHYIAVNLEDYHAVLYRIYMRKSRTCRIICLSTSLTPFLVGVFYVNLPVPSSRQRSSCDNRSVLYCVRQLCIMMMMIIIIIITMFVYSIDDIMHNLH